MILIPSREESLALGIVCPIICAIAIILRFRIRRQKAVRLHADDWLTIPAWISTSGVCVTIIYATASDLLIQDNVPVTPTINEKQRSFAAITGSIPILWLAAAACIKLSILCLYRRIFVGRRFELIALSLIGFSILWTIYAFLSWILYCGSHVKANFTGPWLICPSWGFGLQLAVYVWDTIIDLALLMLPIPFLVKLQMTPRRKLGILLTFMVGSLAFVASLLNTTLQFLYIKQSDLFSSGTEVKLALVPDQIFFYWQAIEIGVGLLSCNLPILHPLYNAILTEPWSFLVRTRHSFFSWSDRYAAKLPSYRKNRYDTSSLDESGASHGQFIDMEGPDLFPKNSSASIKLVAAEEILETGSGPPNVSVV